MQAANHYATIFQTRYHVYRVFCSTHPSGGWWMIAPNQ